MREKRKKGVKVDKICWKHHFVGCEYRIEKTQMFAVLYGQMCA
jgi:hypothetical protein